MRNYIAMVLLLLAPGILFSQNDARKGTTSINTNIPAQAQYSKRITIRNLYFNKRLDTGGKGEILEVEFVLDNLTDDPMDLYIFTIATFEKTERTKSSLEPPIPPRERIRTFVTYPDDLSNFQYPVYDAQGNVKKDANGLEIVKLERFPKNPKAGIDPKTGKAYHLTEKLHIRTTHLSRYRKNYFFFNNVAVLVFESDGKLAYRQLYEIRGKRNR
ncbi:MAG: hypothetical protein A2176_02335 [Spirochaetes bacterium RBG_13_51_14]|nr:MAG: hypothetical protein A2176_02335 [Spirochaetes bacterium RBG_13_51_14]